MRLVHTAALPLTALLLAVPATAALAQDTARAVGGGITAPGWMGKVDAREAAAGMTVDSARFMPMGADGFHVTTGPITTYWNPANTASGTYTVKATFNEPRYMSLDNHPHPYGILVGGSDMGTDQQRYLYCAAYGNGNFIVRGFGPEPFQLNGRRGETHAAVNKAAGKDQPVTQEIAVTVTDENVQCAINGTVVGTYPKADVLGTGKLASTDGVYGLRIGHNTDVMVTGLAVTRPVTK